jgi:hypothetical protein
MSETTAESSLGDILAVILTLTSAFFDGVTNKHVLNCAEVFNLGFKVKLLGIPLC